MWYIDIYADEDTSKWKVSKQDFKDAEIISIWYVDFKTWILFYSIRKILDPVFMVPKIPQQFKFKWKLSACRMNFDIPNLCSECINRADGTDK